MHRFFHPSQIAIKLIKLLIVFSSLITLITTGVQLWSEYGRDVDSIEFRFDQVERGYLESIAENVWQSDVERLELLIKGIIETPDFKLANVRTENGELFASAGHNEDKDVIRKVYPLSYLYRGETIVIGELEVVASLTEVYNRTINRFGLILLSNAIKTFMVAMFMFAVVQALLTRHFDAMVNFACRMDFSIPAEPLKLERGFFGSKRDEIDQLADSLNDMQSSLRHAHEELEGRVKERTQNLSDEIQAHKKTEIELRIVSSAVEQSSNLIFITDIEGVIEYVNPRFTELVGYSADEAIGQNASLIQSGETAADVYAGLWETILSGNEWRGELKDRRKNGELFWASVSIVPVHNEGNGITHFVAMHEDIEVRKAAEETMRNARAAAETANKSKSDFMANMSHELRTPLNAIIGFSDIMRLSVFGPLGSPQYEEYMNFIHSSGTHLLEIINDILDVSAVEAGKLTLREEDVDVNDAYNNAVMVIQTKANEDKVSLNAINLSLPMLRADPLRLNQIFINLLSNAVKFTPENGSVSCDAYVDGEERMVITITDTGVGMDETGLEKAMSKFGQVDSSLARTHEGSGLGLPLTKGLVELHGGTLEIQSTPGEGTKVTISFPSERLVPQAG